MTVESERYSSILINLFSLLFNIGIGILFFCIFDESAGVLLPIVFVSTPWLFKDILHLENSGALSNHKYVKGCIYWLIYSALDLLILLIYYYAVHGETAVYYVYWDEVICVLLAFSLLQLLNVLGICDLKNKRIRIGAIALSIIITISLLSLYQLLYTYYNEYIKNLHFALLGAAIVAYVAIASFSYKKENAVNSEDKNGIGN